MSWATPPAVASDQLRDLRVLVVDDESVIALELDYLLSDAGACVVGPVGNVDEALDLVRTESLSVAVLDVRLGGQTIAPVAEALAERGVPFVFYSGQIENDAILRRWPSAAYVAKPAPSRVLTAAVRKLVGDRQPARAGEVRP